MSVDRELVMLWAFALLSVAATVAVIAWSGY